MSETVQIFVILAVVVIVASVNNKNIFFRKRGNDIEMQIKNNKEN